MITSISPIDGRYALKTDSLVNCFSEYALIRNRVIVEIYWLKALAKELDIPVIALSQLSRAVETRGGSKRPLLSDLRESGAIEQDADIVSFIYRPEYYGIDEWDDEDRSPSDGQAEFIVAKHRNGGLDNIKLKFIAHLGKFENIADFDSSSEFQSKMNSGKNKHSNPDDAFGNSSNSDEENLPF